MPVNMGRREDDSLHHVEKMKTMLTELIDYARADVLRVNDAKAQALFETTAEVLLGLRKAYEDFEEGSEIAWRKAS